MIENAALQLGMPLGPLQLIDEVSIELAINIAEQTKKAMGTNKLMEEIEIVLSTMDKAKRLEKKQMLVFIITMKKVKMVSGKS